MRSWRGEGRREGEDEVYLDRGRREYRRKYSFPRQIVKHPGIRVGSLYNEVNTAPRVNLGLGMLLRGWQRH